LFLRGSDGIALTRLARRIYRPDLALALGRRRKAIRARTPASEWRAFAPATEREFLQQAARKLAENETGPDKSLALRSSPTMSAWRWHPLEGQLLWASNLHSVTREHSKPRPHCSQNRGSSGSDFQR